MSILGTFTQQPADRLDYDVYYGSFFPTGDSVASQVTTCDTGVTATGSINAAADTVKVFVTGGTSGTRYKVTVTATSVAGRIKQSEFYIQVKEF